MKKVLTASRRKWPDRSDRTVIVQRDNAPGHVYETDADVSENGQLYKRFCDFHSKQADFLLKQGFLIIVINVHLSISERY